MKYEILYPLFVWRLILLALLPAKEVTELEKNSNVLTVVLNVNNAEREFRDYKNTRYEKAFNILKGEKNNLVARNLGKAFGEIHSVDPDPIEKGIKDIFSPKGKNVFSKQPLPWYLREFVISLEKKHKASPDSYLTYSVTIKACKERYFYSIKGKRKEDGKWELLHVPYFLKATPEEKKTRGFADTILFLAPELNKKLQEYRRGQGKLHSSEQKPKLKSYFMPLIEWFDIDLDLENYKRDELNGNIIFTATPHVNISKSIRLPPENKPILVISRTFRDAIEKLAESWLNPTTRAILLSAGTGIGKEVLVDLLTDAMRINRKKNRIVISAPSLKTFEDFKDKIRKFFKEIPNNNVPLDNRFILFLDEIHHNASRELRSYILRLIESDELETFIEKILEEKKTEEKKTDFPRIIYVFAASLPPEKLYTLPPLDLWTRIDHTIKILHPLRTNDEYERKEILSEYFLLFWGIFIKQFTESKNLELTDLTNTFLNNLEKNGKFDKLALKFADELCSPLIPLISIRTLRSIIKRLLGKTVNLICQNPRLTEEKLYKKIEGNFKEWIVDIFNEIVPENSEVLF